mmetsp:Transcript_35616/g.106289  ORF Transcript_35616/g.106289 Transcript_35616/m.106289 type:complete len:110 (+) Transcript_35616:232-561(+)
MSVVKLFYQLSLPCCVSALPSSEVQKNSPCNSYRKYAADEKYEEFDTFLHFVTRALTFYISHYALFGETRKAIALALLLVWCSSIFREAKRENRDLICFIVVGYPGRVN